MSRGPILTRPATLAAALLVVALAGATVGHADSHGDRGGERRWKGSGDSRRSGEARRQGGSDSRHGGSERRWKGVAPAPRWNGGDHRGGHRHDGAWGRDRGWRGPRVYVGPRYREHDRDYYRSGHRTGYWYPRPRRYVTYGVRYGAPYYCPPAWRVRVAPPPVPRHYDVLIDVANEPPAGCYYHDPYCGTSFDDLDSYTDHLDHAGHGHTIDIVVHDTGAYLRTLEFAGGYWSVRR